MLGVASRPKLERLPLKLADQLCRRWPFPRPAVAMLPGAADPPALTRQSVRLTHHEHGQLGLAAFRRLVVDEAEHLAQSAHLGPSEMVAEQPQHLRVADRFP